jgi:hypothetical protein
MRLVMFIGVGRGIGSHEEGFIKKAISNKVGMLC